MPPFSGTLQTAPAGEFTALLDRMLPNGRVTRVGISPTLKSKPPSLGGIRMVRFRLKVANRSRCVKVPLEWDSELRLWLMTATGMRKAEKAKLMLLLEEWVDECDWSGRRDSSNVLLQHLAARLLREVDRSEGATPATPAQLGKLAARLASAQSQEESTSLKREIVRRFYGDPPLELK